MRTGSNLNGLLPALFSIIGSGYRNCIVVLSLCRQVEFYMHSLYISGDFITAYVFVIFLLLLPLRKLPLTFLTFIVIISGKRQRATVSMAYCGIFELLMSFFFLPMSLPPVKILYAVPILYS